MNEFEENILTTPQWIKALRDHDAGRLDAAEALYQEMLVKAPNIPDLYHNLGLVRQLRGNHGAALVFFHYALHLNPDFVESHNSVSNCLIDLGRVGEAREYLLKITKKIPGDPRLWFNLGNACLEIEDFRGAEKAYLRALKLKNDYPEALLNLGNVYRHDSEFQKSLECYGKAIALVPDYSLAHNNYGNILSDTDRFAEAEVSYQRAVDLDPNFATAYFNLANAQRDQGKIDLSAIAFQKTVELKPDHGDAHRHLAMTLKSKPFDPHIVAMKKAFEDPSTLPEDRMFMAFGLGKMCDDNELFDQAFGYYNIGNRIKRGTLNYNAAADARFFNGIKSTFNQDFFANTSRFSDSEERPIFIIGMMRSGTTLIEHILACHPKIAGGGELLFFPNIVDPSLDNENGRQFPQNFNRARAAMFGKIANEYTKLVRERCGDEAEMITDKLPQNFLYLGAISRAFPNARIINMQRNPLDVCFSIYAHLFTTGHNYAYNLEELGNYYCLYHELMNHWRSCDPDLVLDLPYRNLVEDTEATVREVLEFVGVEFDPACLEFHKSKRPVKTASASQVREKIYNRSLARWKNYESHLAPLKAMFDNAGISYK